MLYLICDCRNAGVNSDSGVENVNLYDMIGKRQTVRDFQMKQIEETVLKGFRRYVGEMFSPYPDIPYRVETVCSLEEKVGKGLFFVKAPYYISFLTEESREALLNAGYIMEELSLYLAARGIGTCYQGLLKIKKEQEGLKEVLVMAAGYPKRYLYRECKEDVAQQSMCVQGRAVEGADSDTARGGSGAFVSQQPAVAICSV